MAEEDRGVKRTDREPVQERQGVREPQPLDRGVESDRPERKVGDEVAGEGDGREGEGAGEGDDSR